MESVRALIEVPAPHRELLPAYVEAYPEDGFPVKEALRFRELVLAEFDRLVLGGAGPARAAGRSDALDGATIGNSDRPCSA